ncbi:MAG: pilus assembly protein TadG-related protein [Bdellovibrionota bacterium]
MLRQSFSLAGPVGRSRGAQPEQSVAGNIIIMAAFSILALMLTIGLAVDAGNLYRSRLALQRSVDAAALAVMNYVALYGQLQLEEDAGVATASLSTKQSAIDPILEPRAANIVRANLASAGFPHLPPTYAIDVHGSYRPNGDPSAQNTSAFEYVVTATRRVDYYLMGRLPFTHGDFNTITVSATARRKVANVILVLDVSASMNCPADGNCDCLSPNRDPNTTCAKPTKGEKLLEGVRKFLKLFDLNVDRIAIVPFNSRGMTLSRQVLQNQFGVTMGHLTNTAVDQIVTLIGNNFEADGSTNLCDGLIEGQQQARHGIGADDETDFAYVVFSDGAPTAGRFFYNDAKPALAQYPAGSGFHDYISTSVAWVDRQNNVRFGPSPLTQSDAYYFDYVGTNPPLPNDPQKLNLSAGVATCSNAPSNVSPLIASDNDIKPAAQAVFTPCLNTLRSHLPTNPNDPTTWYDADYSTAPNATIGPDRWRETYYNCALQMSDYIRADGGTFFTIGLGKPNPNVDPTDPYQNVGDTQSLKTVFLSRLSLDLEQGQGNPEFSYQGYKTYPQAFSESPDRGGDFLPTPRDADLPLMFQRIANRILLKLIS